MSSPNMTTDTQTDNVDAIVQAIYATHGGLDRWQRVDTIRCALSSSGFAFSSKGQRSALIGIQVEASPKGRWVEFRDFGELGGLARWRPDHLELYNARGELIAQRHQPRDAFKKFSKNLLWDKLDILYFGGYAMWNYLTFPFMLAEPGVTISLASACGEGGGPSLLVDFPAGFPTHSPQQVFHFDQHHRLVRHDYVAEVLSRFATAANCILESQTHDGFRFYTRRRVYPRLGPKKTVVPFPVLVWLNITQLAIQYHDAPGAAR